MLILRKLRGYLLALLATVPLMSCGGGDGVTITGTVHGLYAPFILTLYVHNTVVTVRAKTNGTDQPAADVDFTSSVKIKYGEAYDVSAGSLPPGQVCTVPKGQDTLQGFDTGHIDVNCTVTNIGVPVKVSGLEPGRTLILVNANSGELQTVTYGHGASFGVPWSKEYSIRVSQQPVGQICTVSHSYDFAGFSSTDPSVTCSTTDFTVGGTVQGLAPNTQVGLTNSNGDSLTLNSNGDFQFHQLVHSGASYAISVSQQPDGLFCSLSNGSGSNVQAAVSNVVVSCAPVPPAPQNSVGYSIGGQVNGLLQYTNLTLLNNGKDALTLHGTGLFAFATPVAAGGSYAVTVGTQPAGQTCTVGNGSGSGVNANVTSVLVSCQYNYYSIGGTLTGLAAGHQVVLTNNGADSLTLTSNGSFNFAVPVPYTGGYKVAVASQPVGQACSVDNAAAVNINGPVNTVLVSCTGNGVASATGAHAYVVNYGDGSVWRYDLWSDGSIHVPGSPIAFAGPAPRQVAVDPAKRYAYVLNTGDHTVSQYALDASGGMTALSPATVNTLAQANAIAIEPHGRAVYVTSAAGSVAQYGVDAQGKLLPMAQPTVATGSTPNSVVVNASGTFAYVANRGDGSVSQYSVDASGRLTPLTTATVSTGLSHPGYVALLPGGSYAWVVDTSSTQAVEQFSVGADGALTRGPDQAQAAFAGSAASIAIDPTGQWLVLIDSSHVLRVFSISASPSANALQYRSSLVAGNAIQWGAFDPTGQYYYGVDINLGQIRQFKLQGGSLVEFGVEPSTGSSPGFLAVTP